MKYKIELELDRLISNYAIERGSQKSGLRAEPHHIIGRENKLFRWDLRNIAPLTREEHIEVHNGNENNILKVEQMIFKSENKNKGLKDYLYSRGISYQEFLLITWKRLTGSEYNKPLELIKKGLSVSLKNKLREYRHTLYLNAKEYKNKLK